MILPEDITPTPPDDDDIPFAPDPTCKACGKAWKDHPGTTTLCQHLQITLAALKATAVQCHQISQTIQHIVGGIEPPQTQENPKPNISDLLDGMGME